MDTTEEVMFSHMKFKLTHPPLCLGPEVIATTPEHKHLGVTLHSKLIFESHIREAIIKARGGIGLIESLSKNVSRHVLDQIYKIYVRPHLAYGDRIYYRYDPDRQTTFIHKLKQI